jgi:hypothetical protein
MTRSSIFAGFFATALLIAGCAGSDVSNQQRNDATDDLAKPERVFVYDFASSSADIPAGSAISELIQERTTPPTAEEIALGRQLGALVAEHLIEELNDSGIPAFADGDTGPVPHPGDAVVHGMFVSVDEGSRLMRVLIGFGAGSAELRTLAEFYVVAPNGELVAVASAEVEAEGGRMPGMVVPLGVGQVATIAAAGTAKLFTEAGSESLDGAARRTAKEIAELMVAGYERRGWL